MEKVRLYWVARGASYPSFSIPDFMPLTVPCVSHSSDARNSNRWFRSHIALCDEHARSTNTFSAEPASAYRSRTRSGATCLSWAPEIIRNGVVSFAAIDGGHVPAVSGARRTPGPHVAPTGSDASISVHTAFDAARSYCSAHPTLRSQFASKSWRDWVFIGTPSASVGSAAFARAALS